jgi:histidinol-phosphate aminotransferase
MMKKIEDYLVPWLKSSEAYSARHMDVAWENPDILRLMSNENLVPPSEKVINALIEAARMGNFYPGSGPQLRQKLAEKAGLKAEQVVLGNGSTDLIDIVIRSFVAPGEEAIIPDPSFSMYEARVRVNGGVAVKIPSHDTYLFRIEDILAAITPKSRLVFICSPNNPTGTLTSLEDLVRILDTGLPTFYDEAYYELQGDPVTRAGLIAKYPNLMVNRTFSKAFGIAGFRLGYLFCTETLANFLNRIKIPWNVSLVTLAAALAELEDDQDLKRKQQVVTRGRDYIQQELNAIPGIWVFESHGNFLLIDADILGITGTEIRDRMMEKGVFVRPVSGYSIGKGFFRVTIGQEEHNQKFVNAFKELMSEIQA